MRRFSITMFSLLYVALVVSASAERSTDWARREVAPFTSANHHSGFGDVAKPDTHLSQTKIFETGFVVESPSVDLAAPVSAERHLPTVESQFSSTLRTTRAASRAPPVI
jgi:hypothetical protein